MKRNISLITIVLFFSFSVSAAKISKKGSGEKERYTLENEKLYIEINALRGARVSHFQDKRFKKNIIQVEAHQGLFVDHLAQQDWPGELYERHYDAKIIKDSGKTVSISFSTTIVGEFKSKPQPESKGVVLEKIYTLNDGQTILHVEHILKNPTKTPRLFSLWVQNIQHIGNEPKKNFALRPAVAGIYRFVMPEQPFGEAWQQYRDSITGWQGVVDSESGQGIVYHQDFDFLDAHYNAGRAFTVEWFMTPMALPPGKTWSTKSSVTSFKTNQYMIGATRKYWLGAKWDKDIRKIIFSAGGEAPVCLSGNIVGAKDKKRYPLNITLKAGETSYQLPKGCKPPVFIDGFSYTESEKNKKLRIAEFIGGEHFQRNEPLPGYPPLYQISQPEKKPVFPKPDKIELAPGSQKRILLVNGMFTCGMDLTSVLKNQQYKVSESYESITGKENQLIGFPSLHSGLLKYGTIIFNNANAKLLNPAQRQVISDYLKCGGTIVIIGGTASVQKNWDKNPLAELSGIKPVNVFTPTRINFSGNQNTLSAKLPKTGYAVTWQDSGMTPLAKVGNNVLIGSKKVGKGKLVVCGVAGMGQVEPFSYWKSTEWSQLLGTLLKGN